MKWGQGKKRASMRYARWSRLFRSVFSPRLLGKELSLARRLLFQT
jgi:hypothetical protein